MDKKREKTSDWVPACPILDICAGARIFLSMSAVITWAVFARPILLGDLLQSRWICASIVRELLSSSGTAYVEPDHS